MRGEKLLHQATLIFKLRRSAYGEARQHLHEVAQRWSLVMGHEISPAQVVMCLLELKLCRLKQNPQHLDSITDVAGYAAVMAELLPPTEEESNAHE